VTIAIVGGTGAEGSGLAARWARAGEKVIIGSRDAQRATATAEKLRQQIAAGLSSPSPLEISGAENVAACEAADIVVLTVPFENHVETLKRLKPALRSGQILVDATVPLASSVGGRASRTLSVWQGSAAQQAAELVPQGVPVVAALHNTSAEILQGEAPVDCDVIVCSDHAEAAKTVRALVRKIPGARTVDGGKLENARIVEQITALLVGMNIRLKGHAGIRITGLPSEAYES
jgi:8-hydroxy-5-deazaflavin:NADPH oxidoreductase